MAGRILIIEDDAPIADGVIYALKTEGFKARHCLTASEGLQALREEKPDLVLLDIGLPDMSGHEALKRLRAISQVPVIFLTARSEEIDKILGLELGADDYVVKPFSPRELVARIKAVLRHQRPPAAPNLEVGNLSIDARKLAALYHGEALDLSRYEFRILSILAGQPGRVFSREQLMNLAWEEPDMSLERTVDTHIKTLRAKLKQIEPGEDPIVTHRGTGYSLKEPSGKP